MNKNIKIMEICLSQNCSNRWVTKILGTDLVYSHITKIRKNWLKSNKTFYVKPFYRYVIKMNGLNEVLVNDYHSNKCGFLEPVKFYWPKWYKHVNIYQILLDISLDNNTNYPKLSSVDVTSETWSEEWQLSCSDLYQRNSNLAKIWVRQYWKLSRG